MRHRLAALTAVVAVALVASAIAAQPGGYKGQTSHNRPVTFALRDGKVRNFVAGVNLYCVFQGIYKFDAVVAPRAIAVRNGRFNYAGKDKPRTGDIEIHGRFVAPRKAKGWVQLGTGGCAGKANFNAHHR